MKSKLFLLLLLNSFCVACYSQTVTVTNGISVSHLTTDKFDALKENVISYYGSVGLNYLDRKWFSMFSEIANLRIAGEETNNDLPNGDNNRVTEKFNYVHLNSTFRIKSTKNRSAVFLGAGPYMNFLVNPKNFQSELYSDYILKKTNLGIKTEIGASTTAKKIIVSVNGAYLLNLSPLAKSDYNTFSYRNYLITIGIGYKL